MTHAMTCYALAMQYAMTCYALAMQYAMTCYVLAMQDTATCYVHVRFKHILLDIYIYISSSLWFKL